MSAFNPPFWRASFRFVAGAVLVLAAAYALSEAVDPVYPELRAKTELLQARGTGVEAVTVGNSHNRAIDFSALGAPGLHLWMGGHDLFEAAYVARFAAAEAPRLRYVFLPVQYGLQRLDHAIVGSMDNRGRRRELYARTPLQRPIAGDLDLWVAGRMSPIVREDHWEGVIARTWRPRAPVRLNADGALHRAERTLSLDSLARHAASLGAVHRSLGESTLRVDPTTPARAIRALDSLAVDLRARGVKLVLYTPPYHHTYLREQEAEVIAETRDLLRDLVSRSGNVDWLDFADHPEFSPRDELFIDSDHLNSAGARAFSALLRDCLRPRRPLSADASPAAHDCPRTDGRVVSAPRVAHETTSRRSGED